MVDDNHDLRENRDLYREEAQAAETARWRAALLERIPLTYCRSCKAEIMWCRIRKKDGTFGKVMPVDFGLHWDGNLTPVGGAEKGVPSDDSYTVPVGSHRPMLTLRVDRAGSFRSHFVSCPFRVKYRKVRPTR